MITQILFSSYLFSYKHLSEKNGLLFHNTWVSQLRHYSPSIQKFRNWSSDAWHFVILHQTTTLFVMVLTENVLFLSPKQNIVQSISLVVRGLKIRQSHDFGDFRGCLLAGTAQAVCNRESVRGLAYKLQLSEIFVTEKCNSVA